MLRTLGIPTTAILRLRFMTSSDMVKAPLYSGSYFRVREWNDSLLDKELNRIFHRKFDSSK
jgi:hypothetical protein